MADIVLIRCVNIVDENVEPIDYDRLASFFIQCATAGINMRVKTQRSLEADIR
jgi:hypothetical protein